MHYIELEMAYRAIHNKLDIDRELVLSKSRKHNVIQARHILIYMLYSYNKVKFTHEIITSLMPSIASRSTITHSIARTKGFLEYDKHFKLVYDDIFNDFVKLLEHQSFSTFSVSETVARIGSIIEELNKLKTQLTQLENV